MVHGSQGPSPTESSLPEYLVSMCSFEVLRCTISPVNSQLALWKSGKLELSRTLILFFCNLKRNKDIESKTRQIKTKKHSSGDSRPVTPSSIEKGRQRLSSSKSRLGCGKMFSKNSGKASWCPLCIYLFLFFCCDQTTWKHPSFFPKLVTREPVGHIVHLNSNRKCLMGSSHKQLIVVFNHYIDSVPGNVNRESGSVGLWVSGVCFDLLIYILRWPVCLVFISKAKLHPWKALWDHLIPSPHLPVEGTNSPNTQGFWPLSWAGLCGSCCRESLSCKNLSVLAMMGGIRTEVQVGFLAIFWV